MEAVAVLKAQMILIRAALDEFEQALQAGDLRRARKKAVEVESIGYVLSREMDLAMSAGASSDPARAASLPTPAA